MNIEQIVIAIDQELARLYQVKRLLTGDATPANTSTFTVAPMGITTHQTRFVSLEGRARIAKAQKRRWRALKKAQRMAERQALDTGRA